MPCIGSAVPWMRNTLRRGWQPLGTIYAIGQDVPQDLDKALKLTRKAVKKHSPEGEASLGIFYARGPGCSSRGCGRKL